MSIVCSINIIKKKKKHTQTQLNVSPGYDRLDQSLNDRFSFGTRALYVVFACVYGVVVFITTFDNSSVVSWMSVNWWRRPEYLEKSTDQPQVADKLYTYTHLYMYVQCPVWPQ
jgi:hypothetical protein